MNRLTRILLLIIAALMAGGAGYLGGCRPAPQGEGGTPTAKGKTELSFFVYIPAERVQLFKDIVSEFEERNADITVRLDGIGGQQLMQKLQTRFAGNAAPDVCMIDGNYYAAFAGRGLLMDLTEKAESDPDVNLDDYYPGLVDVCRYDGRLYGLPRITSCGGMIYNQDLFDAAGITYPDWDWTWDDLRKNAKKLTKDLDGDGITDQYGFAIGFNWVGTREFIVHNGGTLFTEDCMHCGYGEPPAIEAMQFMLDLHKDGSAVDVRELEGGSIESLFQSGKLAMFYGSTASMAALTGLDFRWSVAPYPKKKNRKTLSGTNIFSIAAATRHPDEAWKFVKFFCGAWSQEQEAQQTGRMPGLISVAESDAFLDPKSDQYETRKVWTQIAKDAIPIETGIPNANEVFDAIDARLDKVWTGQMTLKAAAAEITKVVDQLLLEGRKELKKS